ncbi:retrotransposon gag protein, partial [Trifolium medium]|nr:retrotransposon gag protein [Trifolium medium]
MPTHKSQSQIVLIRGMDEKVASLEAEISGMKTSMAAMERNQERIIALFEKSLGKKITTEDERPVDDVAKTIGEASVHRNTQSSNNQLEGDALAEFRRSVKKVELPTFDGEDPAGWISRAEVYFRVQDTRSEVKVNLAQLCMEGPTIHFFNSLINENENLNWDQLKQALLERYGGHGEGDVYEQLTELRQRGNVDDYINDFEYLTAQIPRLPDKQFLGYFLHGLKEEIRGKVRSLSVMGDLSRSKVLQVARAVERETKKEVGSGFNRSYRSGHGSTRTGSQKDGDWVFVQTSKNGGSAIGSKENANGPKHERPAQHDRRRNTHRDRGFTQLSYQEIMDRKKRGMCFKCGGAYHPMHQCPDKQLK